MSCERWSRTIALDAGGDLSARRARRLQGHLERCPECRVLSQELRSAREQLQSLAARAAEHEATLQDRMPSAVAELAGATRIPLALRWSAAVAALLLLVAVSLLLAPRRGPTSGVRGPAAISAAVPTPVATPRHRTGRSSGTATAPPPAAAAPAPPLPRPEVRTATGETLLLKIHTDDPDVVIYWLVETEERKSDA